MDKLIISKSNYCLVGNERYFRSVYNNKWYNCKVRATGEDWWKHARYTDEEMVGKNAEPDVKRCNDSGWKMFF